MCTIEYDIASHLCHIDDNTIVFKDDLYNPHLKGRLAEFFYFLEWLNRNSERI